MWLGAPRVGFTRLLGWLGHAEESEALLWARRSTHCAGCLPWEPSLDWYKFSLVDSMIAHDRTTDAMGNGRGPISVILIRDAPTKKK